MNRLLLSVGVVVGLTPLPVLAASVPPQNDAQGIYMGRSRGSHLLSFLSPEQRAMYAEEQGGPVTTPEQRWAQQQTLASMSQADRDRLKSDLQKKWDALPQAEKNHIAPQLAR